MGQIDLQPIGQHSRTFRLGVCHDIAVCSWRGQPTLPAVNMLFLLLGKLRDEQPMRRSYVHLIPEGLGLPDGPTRSRMVAIMKEFEQEMACVGLVVAGSGFWASAMRNAILGLRVLAPRSFDFGVHGSIEELVAWLPESHRKRTGNAVSASALTQLIQQAQHWTTPA
jgi:hypothetical protein